jgi:hypothetical protein
MKRIPKTLLVIVDSTYSGEMGRDHFWIFRTEKRAKEFMGDKLESDLLYGPFKFIREDK